MASIVSSTGNMPAKYKVEHAEETETDAEIDALAELLVSQLEKLIDGKEIPSSTAGKTSNPASVAEPQLLEQFLLDGLDWAIILSHVQGETLNGQMRCEGLGAQLLGDQQAKLREAHTQKLRESIDKLLHKKKESIWQKIGNWFKKIGLAIAGVFLAVAAAAAAIATCGMASGLAGTLMVVAAVVIASAVVDVAGHASKENGGPSFTLGGLVQSAVSKMLEGFGVSKEAADKAATYALGPVVGLVCPELMSNFVTQCALDSGMSEQDAAKLAMAITIVATVVVAVVATVAISSAAAKAATVATATAVNAANVAATGGAKAAATAADAAAEAAMKAADDAAEAGTKVSMNVADDAAGIGAKVADDAAEEAAKNATEEFDLLKEMNRWCTVLQAAGQTTAGAGYIMEGVGQVEIAKQNLNISLTEVAAKILKTFLLTVQEEAEKKVEDMKQTAKLDEQLHQVLQGLIKDASESFSVILSGAAPAA